MGKKQRKKGEQRQGICVYCEQEGLITDDHVFPEAIFLTLDEQMVTVHACETCQQIKGLGDRDLRNYITMDIGGSSHPDAEEIAKRMLRETNVRIRNWVRKLIETAPEVDFVTEDGIVVGTGLDIEFNTDRILIAQDMVVRGLYFHETGAILPRDTPIDVYRIPWEATPKFVQGIAERTQIKIKSKGRDVAWWARLPVNSAEGDSTAWMICYNNWVLYFGTTGPLATKTRELRERILSSRPVVEHMPGDRRRVVVPLDPEGRPIIPGFLPPRPLPDA